MPFIPLFQFASLIFSIGWISKLFPSFFATASNYTAAGGVWIQGTYYDAKAAAKRWLFRYAMAMVLLYALITIGLYLKNWLFVTFAFAISAICMTIVMLAVVAMWRGTYALLGGVETIATYLSARIPLTMPAFDKQPLLIQILMILGMVTGAYGLWILVFLPIRGTLEAVKILTGARHTFGRWVKLFTDILCGLNIAHFFLCSLVVFQMLNKLEIATLPVFGITIVFIFVLINLLFLGDTPMVNLRDFMMGLGFVTLLLDAFVGIAFLLPGLNQAMGQWFQDRYAAVLANTAQSPVMGFLVVATVALGLAWGIKWCRPYAKWIGLFLLLLFVLGTDWTGKTTPSLFSSPYMPPFWLLALGTLFISARVIGVMTGHIKPKEASANGPSTTSSH